MLRGAPPVILPSKLCRMAAALCEVVHIQCPSWLTVHDSGRSCTVSTHARARLNWNLELSRRINIFVTHDEQKITTLHEVLWMSAFPTHSAHVIA